jgi:SAM-dependent methyltransferase
MHQPVDGREVQPRGRAFTPAGPGELGAAFTAGLHLARPPHRGECQTVAMPVAPLASIGFSRSAAAYEHGRPGYPRAAVAWVSDRLGLAQGRTVVDLAAGTGKLSRSLVASGADVVAVEPLPQMRALIDPPVKALEGTAERIPLESASADAVTVAQAFHWFDAEVALGEIHRVLRPDGGLALLWNTRLPNDPVNQAIAAIIAPYRGEAPPRVTVSWRDVLDRAQLFGALEQRHFPNAQTLDEDGVVARVGSMSFIAVLPDRERERVLADVRELTAEGSVTIPYVTEVYVAGRLPLASV